MRFTLKVASLLFLASYTVSNPLFGFGGSTTPAAPAAPVGKWSPQVVFEPGTPRPTPAELGKCVDEAAKRLGIDMSMKTDPAVITHQFKNIMHLDGMEVFTKLLAEDLKTPQPLAPLLQAVRKGVTENHPAIGVVICASLEDPEAKVIYDAPGKEGITRMLNHMYAFNKIVTKVSEDKDVMLATQKYLDGEVTKMIGTTSLLKRIYELYNAAGLFGVMKDYTIKLAMTSMNEMRQRGVTEEDIKARKKTLTINIYEAMGTDLVHGFTDNAYVGKVLNEDKIQSIRSTNASSELRYTLAKSFARLYETWNLAFVIGNLEYMDIILPKLIAPRVLLADNSAYIYERVIALWMTIQFYLMASLQKVPHGQFTGQKQLATLWGKVNSRYVGWIQANNAADKTAKAAKKQAKVEAKQAAKAQTLKE